MILAASPTAFVGCQLGEYPACRRAWYMRSSRSHKSHDPVLPQTAMCYFATPITLHAVPELAQLSLHSYFVMDPLYCHRARTTRLGLLCLSP